METMTDHEDNESAEDEAPDFWQLLEQAPAGCDAVANLWSWSTNYDAGEGLATLFLDLIGWSEDNIGELLYDMKNASLGYVELDKLADALSAYADCPQDVRAFVEDLMAAEGRL